MAPRTTIRPRDLPYTIDYVVHDGRQGRGGPDSFVVSGFMSRRPAIARLAELWADPDRYHVVRTRGLGATPRTALLNTLTQAAQTRKET